MAPGENRLAAESSPYLLLHKSNPVDWYPWGDEALARARREEKPIFLSVGYSTCYWCHVMERESFSNPQLAALMNRDFVNIKLDREERPDLDEVYMAATQILSGQGGWPNSVFLTPDLKPFYAGTYFPPEDRYGRPGFGSLLKGLARAWRERRKDVEMQAEEVAEAMAKFLGGRFGVGAAPPALAVVEQCERSLEESFDPQWGGFGDAPKFPSPSNLLFLLDRLAHSPAAEPLLATTLDRMARGGIYDHLGGGFHRYATDRQWKVPHFEKMLYDNGLLLEVYGRWSEQRDDPQAAFLMRQTAAFLGREMTAPEGGFWSALDAETEGREGAFYGWSEAQLREVLDGEEFDFLAPLLGFSGSPFFEDEHWVLHLPEPLDAVAAERRLERAELWAEMEPLVERLWQAREQRPRPLTDDKVLTDWNGTAIAGLARAGGALGEAGLVEQAKGAAQFVLDELWAEGGPLLHTWRRGEAKIAAFLADYAFLARGLLELDRVDPEGPWLAAAVRSTEEQISRLRAPAGGFFVAAEADDLILRSRDVFDGALPAANAAAVDNLLRLAERTGEERWRAEAEAALAARGPQVAAVPQAARGLCAALWRGSHHAAGEAKPVEIEVVFAEPRGEERAFEVVLEIAAGWHLDAPSGEAPGDAGRAPVALLAAGGELLEVDWPVAEESAAGAIYRGSVRVRGRLRQTASEATLEVRYQPCDEQRCLLPATFVASLPQ
ncbi:MAG: DUF255 domain-containing protein [Acidobacteriota bacterium]